MGALTNWDERTLEFDLSFLPEGNYKAEIFRDGVNAHRNAHDYVTEIIDVPPGRKISVRLAPGGGYIARLYKP